MSDKNTNELYQFALAELIGMLHFPVKFDKKDSDKNEKEFNRGWNEYQETIDGNLASLAEKHDLKINFDRAKGSAMVEVKREN